MKQLAARVGNDLHPITQYGLGMRFTCQCPSTRTGQPIMWKGPGTPTCNDWTRARRVHEEDHGDADESSV